METPITYQDLFLPVEDGQLAIAFCPAAEKFSDQPPIILFHGNGMNGWCHRRILEDYVGLHPIYLVDFRGHGLSSAPASADLKNWDVFYADAEQVLAFASERHPDLKPHIIAHSLGALVSIEMLNRGFEFTSMNLIEPVLLKPWEVHGVRFAQKFGQNSDRIRQLNPKVRQALKRRSGWATRGEVEQSYKRKSFFRAFDPQVLTDYLDRGLKTVDGKVVLSCTPEFEAQIFHHLDTRVVSKTNIRCPKVTVIVGETESTTVSKQGRRILAKRFPDALVKNMPDQGHFMPFNVPDQVKALLNI
ncbi:MAG: alpha/beta fold hydrolase [Alphaproteobacteria bacterium]